VIKIDSKTGEVQIEGTLGDLITEGATLIDSLAQTISKKTDSKEIDYDFIIRAVLVHLAQISKFQNLEDNWSYEDEINFRHELDEMRSDFSSDSSFIDIDTMFGSEIGPELSSKKKTTERAVNGDEVSGLTGIPSMDDFIIDSRISSDVLDLEDLKAIKKLRKK
jgi:hypothetical protein